MPNRSKQSYKALGNYVAGHFEIPADSNGELISRSPADFTDELGRFPYSYRSVEAAVASAAEGFDPWRKLTPESRTAHIRRLTDVIRKRGEELALVIAREIGKPLWEAREEIECLLARIDATLSEGLRFVPDYEIQSDGAAGICRHRPLGVMAVVGPFSSPLAAPCAHLMPALFSGNTAVFKPSERAPLVAQCLAECFAEAGFPAGVFNLLQGEKEVGRRLVVHEQVNGVLFTGSYEVGTRIKQDTLLQHWKCLALEMGGKNPAIVWDDTDLDLAVHQTLVGAFATAGQRCTSTSRIIVQRRKVDEFVARFHERAKAFSIGNPLDNPFMGPLIDQGSVDRYMKFIGIAIREGAELVMRGKALEFKTQGNFVTPSICWLKESSVEATRKSVYQQSEMLGPNVAILAVDTVEEAAVQANLTQYGLIASVFTRSRETYEKLVDQLQFGMVNWNRSTRQLSPRLPIGGLKKSGNHMPTGIAAAAYCVTPLSLFESKEPIFPTQLEPGLNWK